MQGTESRGDEKSREALRLTRAELVAETRYGEISPANYMHVWNTHVRLRLRKLGKAVIHDLVFSAQHHVQLRFTASLATLPIGQSAMYVCTC